MATSDLLGVVPGRLVEASAQHLPIKVLPLPVPNASYEIRLDWHERYDREPAIQWMWRALVAWFMGQRRNRPV